MILIEITVNTSLALTYMFALLIIAILPLLLTFFVAYIRQRERNKKLNIDLSNQLENNELILENDKLIQEKTKFLQEITDIQTDIQTDIKIIKMKSQDKPPKEEVEKPEVVKETSTQTASDNPNPPPDENVP